MMIENVDIVPATEVDDLKDKLLSANSKKDLEAVVSLFNLDLAKRNIIRSKAYSDMVDKVIDEMGKRIDTYPGQFSNKELLEYMSALQNQFVKSADVSKDLPTIAIQQNVINVNSPLDKFDRESKDRMREVLGKILSSTQNISQDETKGEEENV